MQKHSPSNDHGSDRLRYWELSQLESAGRGFAPPAVEGLEHRFGHLAREGERPFDALESIFDMASERVGELRRVLDDARLESRKAGRRCRSAVKRRTGDQKVLRREVCHTRQVVHAHTGHRANELLGVRGPTPRHPDKLGEWGTIFYEVVADAENPIPIHEILREELADALQPALTRFEEAVELEAEAQVVKKHRDRDLADVREICDEEIRQIKNFLQVTLEWAGHDFLSQRVLGKRRGRPRKTARGCRRDAASARCARATPPVQ